MLTNDIKKRFCKLILLPKSPFATFNNDTLFPKDIYEKVKLR